MKILIIDTNSQKNSIFKDEFVKPIEQILKLNKIKFQTKHFLEKINFEKYQKIILSGTPLKDFFYLKKIEKFNWIKISNKSILGICAGAQIIGEIFGAKLIEKKEIGMIEIKKIKKNILFDEIKFNVYSLHKKSLINLNKFEIIAKSNKCSQIIKLKNKEIYGILFHPEIKNQKIILNFIKN